MFLSLTVITNFIMDTERCLPLNVEGKPSPDEENSAKKSCCRLYCINMQNRIRFACKNFVGRNRFQMIQKSDFLTKIQDINKIKGRKQCHEMTINDP